MNETMFTAPPGGASDDAAVVWFSVKDASLSVEASTEN
jgi:hypothetical protein